MAVFPPQALTQTIPIAASFHPIPRRWRWSPLRPLTARGRAAPASPFEALDASTGRVARLRDAFEYDAFVVEPGTGALSGGTRVIVRGHGAHYTGIP